MASKELIEEITFIIRHDKDGSPEDTARDILEVILAALQEHIEALGPALRDLPLAAIKAFLETSPLGEQSE